MPRLELRPFADADLDAARALLTERHRRHGAPEPLLSPRYENSAAALVEIEAARRQDGAVGAVATLGADVLAYVVGAPPSAWGPDVWIAAAGHARERRYDTILVDWRVTNLESSRFGPSRGFRETSLRLHRSVP